MALRDVFKIKESAYATSKFQGMSLPENDFDDDTLISFDPESLEPPRAEQNVNGAFVDPLSGAWVSIATIEGSMEVWVGRGDEGIDHPQYVSNVEEALQIAVDLLTKHGIDIDVEGLREKFIK